MGRSGALTTRPARLQRQLTAGRRAGGATVVQRCLRTASATPDAAFLACGLATAVPGFGRRPEMIACAATCRHGRSSGCSTLGYRLRGGRHRGRNRRRGHTVQPDSRVLLGVVRAVGPLQRRLVALSGRWRLRWRTGPIDATGLLAATAGSLAMWRARQRLRCSASRSVTGIGTPVRRQHRSRSEEPRPPTFVRKLRPSSHSAGLIRMLLGWCSCQGRKSLLARS